MKKVFLYIVSTFFILAFTSFTVKENNSINYNPFPYQKFGLTEKEAAAHLLSRFTFGYNPSMVDSVAKTGLENWFNTQLNQVLTDTKLDELLVENHLTSYSNEEILNKYYKNNEVLKIALKEGVITKEEATNKKDTEIRQKLLYFMKQKGWLPVRELMRQQVSIKILRAAYTNNQLQEVMTDFWYNHFNISATKNQCVEFIPVYERDAIRKNCLKNFEDLVLATAKSPAMLLYLDNAMSTSDNNELQQNIERRRNRLQTETDKIKKYKSRGLNENYAREVMELHTLGVDGGYTQKDVTEVARVLTGWTVYPISSKGPLGNLKKVIEKNIDKFSQNGFVREGDFLFAANRHDDGEKYILGRKFNKGGGYQEGVELLKMLANHQSTAQFICKKLAVRFVSDNPPQTLIDKLSKTFLATNGNIKRVLLTMVSSPEFWSKDALREKVKSPFELAISSVRVLNADISKPFQLYNWITNMGQKLYSYQAPTGFPDNANYWINTGTLLNRMNFGLAIATNKIPGVKYNINNLTNNKEPESAEQALTIYATILLPQRNINSTIKRLLPFINDKNLIEKMGIAEPLKISNKQKENLDELDNFIENTKEQPYSSKEVENNKTLMQIVGIILGSPEFQRK